MYETGWKFEDGHFVEETTVPDRVERTLNVQESAGTMFPSIEGFIDVFHYS